MYFLNLLRAILILPNCHFEFMSLKNDPANINSAKTLVFAEFIFDLFDLN